MLQNIVKLIKTKKIIAIIRKVYGDNLDRLCEALLQGGIELLEITVDQSDGTNSHATADELNRISEIYNQNASIGAGTVISVEQAHLVAAAGAEFIISPNTNKSVIQATKEMNLISIPGAMTPTEIISAHNYGADFVKLFPAADLGLNYIKSITAPINHISLVATGGINANNIAEYIGVGCIAAGVGGALTDKKLIDSGDFKQITARAKQIVKAVSELG